MPGAAAGSAGSSSAWSCWSRHGRRAFASSPAVSKRSIVRAGGSTPCGLRRTAQPRRSPRRPLSMPPARWSVRSGNLGLDLPIFSELHPKLALEDRLGVIPRDAPLVIWEDDQRLPWTDEERETLAESEERSRHLLDTFPAGIHFRRRAATAPRRCLCSGPITWSRPPRFPVPLDPTSRDRAARHVDAGARPCCVSRKAAQVPRDGGYHSRHRRTGRSSVRCQSPAHTFFAALSGYGLMAACAGGELLAAHHRRRFAAVCAGLPAQPLRRPDLSTTTADWGSTRQL